MKVKTMMVSAAVAIAAILSSCSLTKKLYNIPSEVEVPLTMQNVSVSKRYRNLDKEIALTVKSSIQPENMYNDDALPKTMRMSLPKYSFTPGVKQFAQNATTGYMQQLGFDVSAAGDYRLVIDVKTMCLSWIDKKSCEATVKLSYKLNNEAGETVIAPTTVSANAQLGGMEQFGTGLGRVYGLALAKIDWEHIAEFLTIARQAKDEKNASVKGDGDTALEHTVIRWFINSTPQGADVSWRVISSTPDVSNTNSNYVGSTPYETTESFDIKGLTYNNSGNVQVEITCERPGYLPQKKRFNVRQAIDQKEISAKFNLIKDE